MINPKSLIEMLESSYDGIWITDGNGRILFANSANASLLGVTKEDLMGKSTEELLEKKIFSDSVCLEAIEQKRQTSKVCYNYNTQLTVLATATPIFGENGEVRYIFNNVRDITSLNNMQASLRDKEEIIRRQNKQLEDMKIRLGVGTIIANSESFRKVVELAQRVATFDGATVLILGESGTGKELVSELLVNNSPRKDMPYLQVNCGAIPENLIESELFGYEKGAFTGADNRGHKGLFEAANGGTVFLDEIGDLPLHMQVKLLRVLQQRKVTRVGGTEPIYQRPGHRGHQQESGADGSGGTIPGGSVLPSECGQCPDSAPAGAEGGHRTAAQPLSDGGESEVSHPEDDFLRHHRRF